MTDDLRDDDDVTDIHLACSPDAIEGLVEMEKLSGAAREVVIHYCFSIGRIIMRRQVAGSEISMSGAGDYEPETLRHFLAVMGEHTVGPYDND